MIIPILIDENGCWLWTGTKNKKGYAVVKKDRRKQRVIRLINKTPDHLFTDHLCGNTSCVNPEHLESVTNAQNARRQALRSTHCPNGHEYTEESTYDNGTHKCKICSRISAKKWRDKNYKPHPRQLKEFCQHGHNEWKRDAKNRRYCVACDRIRSKEYQRKLRMKS